MDAAGARGAAASDDERAPLSTYRGSVIVFGTQHDKGRHVAPAFADVLGAQVIAPPALDTDQFGTFAGDIPRRLVPLEAARAKARLAMEATGGAYALASEASYGILPGIGWPGHDEILLFLDDSRGLEIVEGHRTLSVPGAVLRANLDTDMADIADALARAEWPEQAVVVRPAALLPGATPRIVTGIRDVERLSAAIRAAVAESADGHARIEPDLRAHMNPSRQQVLTQLSLTLAHRLATVCPACASPGYGRTGIEKGLPCAQCRFPTEQARADVFSCALCPHREAVQRPATAAEPVWCQNCNP